MTKTAAKLIDPTPPRLSFSPPIFDEDAVARADEALREMSGSFRGWLEAEVQKLQSARAAAVEAGWTPLTIEAVRFAAHDLKGLGATYEYPIITQIAASLCRLLDIGAGAGAASLICSHIDAIRAAARDGVKTDGDAMGRALLRTLEERVSMLGGAAD